MKTLLTTLFTLFLFNAAYAICIELDPWNVSYVPPEECIQILNTRSDEVEISDSLVSKYRKCINSKLAESDVNLFISINPYERVDNYMDYSHLWDYQRHGENEENPYNHIHGEFSFHPNPGDWQSDYSASWFASSKDGYNVIYTKIHEERHGCCGVCF